MIWRFAIVKLNKSAKLSVASSHKGFVWKFHLWNLQILEKHFTEMILLFDEKQRFMLGRM